MGHRSIQFVGIALVAGVLLGAGTASASVKCLCNDGSVTWDMGADPDDDDVAAACNDACSTQGGGSVWTPSDESDDDDAVRPVERRPVERR